MEIETVAMEERPPVPPDWLVFVEKAPDDGPWLRMMVLNPFNGALCPLVNTPIEAETQLPRSD